MIDAGNGIMLKPLRRRDARAIYRHVEASRERLGEWLPWVERTHSVRDSRPFLAMARRALSEGCGMHCGIWAGNEMAGVIGFNTIDRNNRNVTIGYWIGKDHEGKGIMSRAVRAMTSYAFRELGSERVEIRAATGNQRSRAIPERMGFQMEGVLRHNEKLPKGFVDHCVYSMLREEWEKKGL
jgi:ribosomal-protein-serine acetyltransferase